MPLQGLRIDGAGTNKWVNQNFASMHNDRTDIRLTSENDVVQTSANVNQNVTGPQLYTDNDFGSSPMSPGEQKVDEVNLDQEVVRLMQEI